MRSSTSRSVLWYTEDNYYKLAKLFDDAYSAFTELRPDGVTEILTKLPDDAAKIEHRF